MNFEMFTKINSKSALNAPIIYNNFCYTTVTFHDYNSIRHQFLSADDQWKFNSLLTFVTLFFFFLFSITSETIDVLYTQILIT